MRNEMRKFSAAPGLIPAQEKERVQWIVTETKDGIETGYVTCDGEPQFDFDRDIETGEYRTCGYGPGCFWTDWQGARY